MYTRKLNRASLLHACFLLVVAIAPSSVTATSFELDVKDLETGVPAKRTPKRKPPPPAATRRDFAPGDVKGAVSRYTVKPGDFIFRILMREYGLSNAAAEALIPEIQRINNLPSITRLSVGQTILIPLERPRNTAGRQDTEEPRKPVETTSVSPSAAETDSPVAADSTLTSPPAAPQAVEAPVPAATRAEPIPAHLARTVEVAPSPSPPPAAAPVPASSFAQRLILLWQKLVPGQERVEPITLNGKVLSPEEFPLLLAADGGRILVDVKGSLHPRDKNSLSEKYPDVRLVSRGTGSERDFFSALLRSAEFVRVEEDSIVTAGSDPRLSVRPDYRIVRLPAAATRGPESVYLFLGRNRTCLPATLTETLTEQGLNVAEFCEGPPPHPSVPGYELRGISATTPCEMAVELLDALTVKLDRNRIVSGSMGENAESRFSIRVEGYFESDGKKFILSCNENDSYNYTLFRLLQLEGYGIIQLGEKDDFATVADRILTALRYPHSFGRHDFTHDRYTISAVGFRVTRLGPVSGRMLIIDRPAAPALAELLKWER